MLQLSQNPLGLVTLLLPFGGLVISANLCNFMYRCRSDYRFTFQCPLALVSHGAFASALLPHRVSKSIRADF